MLPCNILPAVKVKCLVIAHGYEKAIAEPGIEGDRNDIGAVAVAGFDGDFP